MGTDSKGPQGKTLEESAPQICKRRIWAHQSFVQTTISKAFIHRANSKVINIHKHKSHNKNKNNKHSSNINPIKRYITPKFNKHRHWKIINYFVMKIITWTTITIKQIVKDNSKNTNSLSNTGVYKIYCLHCNKFYIGKQIENQMK